MNVTRLRTVQVFTATIRLTSPGGVMAPQSTPILGEATGISGPDAVPVVELGNGSVMPGTTLAGSFRQHLRSRGVGDTDLVRLMGRGGQDPNASRLCVLGGRTPDRGDQGFLDEHSTAVDRYRGAARESTKRHVRRLPPGTEFITFWLLENPTPGESAVVSEALGTWHPLLGSSVTNGRGDSQVVEVRTGTLDLSDERDLLLYLTHHGPELCTMVATDEVAIADPEPRATIVIPLRIVEPLHFGTGETTQSTTRPRVNLVVRMGQDLVIPGRSVRGILRSRLDYMLHTLGLADCPEQRCGVCLSCELFGFTSPTGGRRASVRILDSAVRDARTETLEHVAIDRFTGGAKDSALFTDEVIIEGTFEVVIERLDPPSDAWRLLEALVRLVAQDLHEGFVRLGGGASRGYGRVELAPEPAAGPRLMPLDQAQHTMSTFVGSRRP